MNAKDLIPGLSYVMYYGEIFKYLNQDADGFFFISHLGGTTKYLFLHRILPIEITSELLSKAYYEKDGEKIVAFNIYQNQGFLETEPFYDIEIMLSTSDQILLIGDQITITIECLHQLQAILYHLFRIELKLDL